MPPQDPKYVAVNIPKSLAKKIDRLIADGSTDHLCRAEFVRDTLSHRVEQLTLASLLPSPVVATETAANAQAPAGI